MKIKFINVGRNNANWEAECSDEDLTYDFLLSQVRPHLVSSNISFLENGSILAGIYTVGKFEVVEE